MRTFQQRFLIIAAVSVIALAAAYAIWRGASPRATESGPGSATTQASGRRPAPEIALRDASGNEFKLSALRGNVVVVHFWASWCPPCIDEIGQWVKAADSYAGKPVKFVAVSLDEKWEDAWKLLPKSGLPSNVTSLLDLKKDVSDQFGTYQFPESYIVDKSQRILMKLVGPQDWESAQIQALIAQALSEA